MAQTAENSKGNVISHQEEGATSADRAFRCEIGRPRARFTCQSVGPVRCLVRTPKQTEQFTVGWISKSVQFSGTDSILFGSIIAHGSDNAKPGAA
jgi:hypothetical protein